MTNLAFTCEQTFRIPGCEDLEHCDETATRYCGECDKYLCEKCASDRHGACEGMQLSNEPAPMGGTGSHAIAAKEDA